MEDAPVAEPLKKAIMRDAAGIIIEFSRSGPGPEDAIREHAVPEYCTDQQIRPKCMKLALSTCEC